MDSPRGRIQLMEKTAQGTLRLSPAVVEHFDRCLGCMACVSSCPSGVRYDLLIEETRALVEDEHPRPRGERLQRRLLFATLPHPAPAACRAPPRAPRAQAARPAVGTADARPRARVALGRAAARRHARDGGDRRRRRPAHRVRPVRAVRRREHGDGARARRGGLRGPRAGAGMLRRALPARRVARASRPASPSACAAASTASSRSW